MTEGSLPRTRSPRAPTVSAPQPPEAARWRMTPVVKLAVVALSLGAAFSAGAMAGTVVGPIEATSDAAQAPGAESSEHGLHQADGSDAAGQSEAESLPDGVLMTQGGYSLQVDSAALTGVEGAAFGFQIVGPDGTAVQAFELRHERELHLILVNRDLVTYHHLHPARDADGRWSIQLPALPPGLYRAFTSFAASDGPALTLGADLLVPGGILPFAPLPPATPVALVDGYVVTLGGTAVAGAATELGFSVERDGAVVTDLEPYLGARGHLVALRAGDLAYSHVHPADGADATVPFLLQLPSPGSYRLFFDFSHGGGVHTAAFTVHVPAVGDHQPHTTDPPGVGGTTTTAAAEPTGPADPTAPQDQPQAPDPADPMDPTNPTDPTGPAEPTNPTIPADPTNPTDPTSPADPTYPTDPSGTAKQPKPAGLTRQVGPIP